MQTEEPGPAAQSMSTPISNEESYQLLIESVQEYAIIMLDRAGCIVTWNVGAQRLFGYPGTEALGQHGALIFTEEDRAAGAPEAEILTALQEGKAEDERWHLRQDGSRFWGSGILTRLTAPDGSIRGFAKILRDNTERRAAEETQRVLNESLEALVEERTAQVRTLASLLTLAEQEERRRISQILHDNLQQQLYGIQMRLASLLAEVHHSESATLAKDAQEAYAWLEDAIRLTRQLTVDLSPPLLDGEGLVDALHWLASQMAQVNGLQVHIQADDVFAIADEDMRVLLFQIVRELLFNVVKHAGTNQATVALRASASGQISISVEDSGRGFDVAKAEADHAGGFGLFSVRARLRLFGGHVAIDSAPGQGTRVTLFVPVRMLAQPSVESVNGGQVE